MLLSPKDTCMKAWSPCKLWHYVVVVELLDVMTQVEEARFGGVGVSLEGIYWDPGHFIFLLLGCPEVDIPQSSTIKRYVTKGQKQQGQETGTTCLKLRQNTSFLFLSYLTSFVIVT